MWNPRGLSEVGLAIPNRNGGDNGHEPVCRESDDRRHTRLPPHKHALDMRANHDDTYDELEGASNEWWW